MGARRGVSLFGVVVASLALLAQPAIGESYQARRTSEFTEAMILEGRPPVWLTAAAAGMSVEILHINDAVRACDWPKFSENRRYLQEYRDNTDGTVRLMRNLLQKDRARLAEAETKLAEAERQRAQAKTEKDIARATKAAEAAQKEIAHDRAEVEATIKTLQRVATEVQSVETLLAWADEAWDDACRNPIPPPPPPPRTASSRCPDVPGLIDEVNRARADPPAYAAAWRGADAATAAFLRNRPPSPALVESPMLDAAAQQHADDQTRTGFTGHQGSDGSTPMRRIQGAGLFSTMTAEVISTGQSSPSSVVRQLIVDSSSPTKAHREDLFNPNFVLAGAGCGEDERLGRFVVIDLSNEPVRRD